ncbi:MAG: hypothetical protein EZS28_011036 [Streblomastix strix]|uniref:Uncharacterized protein n=1 Tax=Streblomastix strix TaxID=222440 RepID=A0A5J4WEU9_9EUKA|nr:MAG: hypothetical protein EZS28_011036 [Streblomastix strix]
MSARIHHSLRITNQRVVDEQSIQNERNSNHPILRYPEVALVSPVGRRELEALLPCRLKSLQKFSIIKIATDLMRQSESWLREFSQMRMIDEIQQKV